jgi:hypothetical protein
MLDIPLSPQRIFAYFYSHLCNAGDLMAFKEGWRPGMTLVVIHHRIGLTTQGTSWYFANTFQ